ncbi:MAG: S9 family peptidase [Chloroflexota bacterium]
MTVAPYGSWKSPITSDLIVAGMIGLGQIVLDGDDIYWTELRPAEGGRNVVVRRQPNGNLSELTPAPFNVRTRVHEYGGGSFTVSEGVVYFSNFADQQIYRLIPGSDPTPLTPALALRYADGVIDLHRSLLFCVREDHTKPELEAVNTIVSLALDDRVGSPEGSRVLISGNDFYSSPRLSPDGSRLAWLTWNHPNMPWEGTELWVGELTEDGLLIHPELVAGGLTEAIFQPQWSPDGVLYFVSDRSGWWNLYRWHEGQSEPLYPLEAEFGLPHWVFGMSTYGFLSATQIICSYIELGIARLGLLDLTTRQLETVAMPYTDVDYLQVGRGYVVFEAGSPTETSSIVRFDLTTRQFEVLRRSSDLVVDPGYLSLPQTIEFPTENGLTAYAFFYSPQNQDYTAPTGERPPLLVKSHGGPTGASSSVLNLRTQYWTSRGYAVLTVNYGGSTGYGRAYRQRLNCQWGIVDVDDCVNGARYLVERGAVDGNRLTIEGGSAGGYTTLAVLTFRDLFKAGASHFGVSDLEALAKETHKFESRYLDSIIGPYPERRDLYLERSPLHFSDRLSCALILFQGLEDKVVPPNQAEMMFEAVKAKGLPVAYVPFEGEQHGFRRSENIKRSLDAQFYFFARVFGFEPAESIEPVVIENL